MKPITNNIGWCHATVNFWWGCDEVSPACAHCYAREWSKFTSRHLFGEVVEWGQGKARAERLEAARREALALERAAIRDGVRYRVFSLSMGDWLDEEVPIAWLAFMLRTIFETPHLDWLLLTKRPENWEYRIRQAHRYLMGDHYPEATSWLCEWKIDHPPVNVWIGVTVENQRYADERIPALLQIPARVRFLSCEPLLGALNLDPWIDWNHAPEEVLECPVHWVIAGGESGPHARPMHPDWARSLRDQCTAADVAFYLKQWGEFGPDLTLPHKVYTIIDGAGKVPLGRMLNELRDDEAVLGRAGRHLTSRLLDGVEHSAFPDSSFVIRHSSLPA